MDQKAVGIVMGIIILVGVAALTYTRLNAVPAGPSPSPSIDPLLNQLGSQPVQQPVTRSAQIKQYAKFPGVLAPNQLANKKAVIQTSKGSIEFEIYPEATQAASNFILLAGDKFYDGLTFHRVEPGFVIQGGDPLGNGTGGPGYRFEDEPVTRKYTKGIVAMANAGPNTNGSQFFIMLADHPELPPNYTIFGNVIKGQEVVDTIKVGDVMQQVNIENLK